MKQQPKHLPTSRWHMVLAYAAGSCMGLAYHCMITGNSKGFWGAVVLSSVGIFMACLTERMNRDIEAFNKKQVQKN